MSQENIHSLHLNESGAPTGGAERYLIALHQALEQSGNPAILVYDRNEPGTYSPPGKSFIIPGVDSNGNATSLLELISQIPTDIVHFHNNGNAALTAQAATIKPSLRTVHDPRLFCPLEFHVQKDGNICHEAAGSICLPCMNEFELDPHEAMSKLSHTLAGIEAAKKLAVILAPSAYMKEQLLINGFDEGKIIVLPPFLLNEQEEILPGQPEPIDLLFVGRLVKEKGSHFLLKALALLPKDTNLTIVGDGPELMTGKRLAESLNLESRINFTGWIDGKELNRYYRRSKIVVVPSMWPETFGLIGLEAMALAKPVVAFDSGGISQWLTDGVNGYLIPRGNTEALALKLGQLLGDQETRNTLGTNGLQILKENFRQKTHLEKLLTVYRDMTN